MAGATRVVPAPPPRCARSPSPCRGGTKSGDPAGVAAAVALAEALKPELLGDARRPLDREIAEGVGVMAGPVVERAPLIFLAAVVEPAAVHLERLDAGRAL